LLLSLTTDSLINESSADFFRQVPATVRVRMKMDPGVSFCTRQAAPRITMH
jgi:hypothetical protein